MIEGILLYCYKKLQDLHLIALACLEKTQSPLIQTEIFFKPTQMLKPFLVMSFVISKLGCILFDKNYPGNLSDTFYAKTLSIL